MYGVVFVLESFRHYIEGTDFKVLTDHQPLTHLM